MLFPTTVEFRPSSYLVDHWNLLGGPRIPDSAPSSTLPWFSSWNTDMIVLSLVSDTLKGFHDLWNQFQIPETRMPRAFWFNFISACFLHLSSDPSHITQPLTCLYPALAVLSALDVVSCLVCHVRSCNPISNITFWDTLSLPVNWVTVVSWFFAYFFSLEHLTLFSNLLLISLFLQLEQGKKILYSSLHP